MLSDLMLTTATNGTIFPARCNVSRHEFAIVFFNSWLEVLLFRGVWVRSLILNIRVPFRAALFVLLVVARITIPEDRLLWWAIGWCVSARGCFFVCKSMVLVWCCEPLREPVMEVLFLQRFQGAFLHGPTFHPRLHVLCEVTGAIDLF